MYGRSGELRHRGAGECPDNAKIGTVSIQSVALAEPFEGSLYFGEPKPDDQYRIFMMANGYGIHSKLVGSAKPDPLTGQVKCTSKTCRRSHSTSSMSISSPRIVD